MEECPVCQNGKKYTNKGVWIHIGKLAQTDTAHRAYRDKHQVGASQMRSITPDIDALDELIRKLECPKPEPVYKERAAPKEATSSKPLDETPQSSIPGERPRKLVRKLKVRDEKQSVLLRLRLRHERKHHQRNRIKQPKEVRQSKDPEKVLEIITKIPAVTLVLVLLYKAATDFRFFTRWMDTDIAELYLYVLANPSDPGSIIILVLSALLTTMVIFVLHRLVWRLLFRDLQIRYMKCDPKTGKLTAIGTSKEARIFLTIGRGAIDKIYRKIAKVPRPDVVTIYFKRRGFVNPFKVLASCEKGYLREPVGTHRFVTEGLFKRTLIATHLRRDTEDNSTIFWFEDGQYQTKEFNSEWYRLSHMGEITTGLAKVSKACGMDSTIQKDQMRNVISWLPTELVIEQKKAFELKQSKMKGAEP